jgi:hypothetical protein
MKNEKDPFIHDDDPLDAIEQSMTIPVVRSEPEDRSFILDVWERGEVRCPKKTGAFGTRVFPVVVLELKNPMKRKRCSEAQFLKIPKRPHIRAEPASRRSGRS